MKCERCGRENPDQTLYCEACGEKQFKAKIRLVDTIGRDNTIYLFAKDYLIGREESCDVFLDDPGVSRKHARVLYKEGRFQLEDMRSKNGVLVNNEKPFHATRLKNFDCIQIGGAFLHFYQATGDLPEQKAISNTGEFVQKTLLKVSRDIRSKNMLDEVLNTILDGMTAMAQAAEAGFWTFDREINDWKLYSGRNMKLMGGGDVMERKIRKLAGTVAAEKRIHLYHEDGHWEYFEQLDQAAGAVYSVLAFPLLSRGFSISESAHDDVLGIVYLKSLGTGRMLDSRKITLLESLASQCVVAMENNVLYREALAKRRMDNELELARKMQSQLLPREIVQAPNTDIAWYSRARNYVGGDYYDVLKIRETELALVISDISGKGMSAALAMSSLQGSLRAQIIYEQSPLRLVANVNQLFRQSTPGNVFATFFFCLYDYRTGALRYVNAGHNPPLLVRKNGDCQFLKEKTLPLGVLEQKPEKESSERLEDGDTIVFYTDGLSEAMNENMEKLGVGEIQKNILSSLGKNDKITAKEVLNRLLKRVEKHVEKQPQHDDLTILILKRTVSD